MTNKTINGKRENEVSVKPLCVFSQAHVLCTHVFMMII